MSGCGNNPAVGKPENLKDPNYYLYNPAGVRLYGLPGPPLSILADGLLRKNIIKEINSDEKLKNNIGNLKDTVESLANIVMKVFGSAAFDNFSGINGGDNDDDSNNDQQIVCLTQDKHKVTKILRISVNLERSGSALESIGIIHGYSYEGHCYKLPKPQIMFLPVKPRNIVGGCCGSEEDGCECGYAASLGYAVWQIDKLERVVALDVRSDDVKTLVLEQNMPGNRSPQAYAQTMMLAPQRPRE